MKFLIPALVLSACLPAAFSQEQIIPKPAEITVFHGKPAQLTPASAIITATQDKAFLNRARQLQQMLGEGTGLPLPLKTVSYTHLRAHETRHDLVCRLLLEKKKKEYKN